MRVYFDTGVFIDFLSTRGNTNSILRSSERRGRTPAEVAVDAERLFESRISICSFYYANGYVGYRKLIAAWTQNARHVES